MSGGVIPGGTVSGGAIRPAATLILWRKGPDAPEVLMGRRSAQAAFMPSQLVFPGGAVDPGDDWPGPALLSGTCLGRLGLDSDVPAGAILGAALRELAEETGLGLRLEEPPVLRFVLRAITPAGRTRRFDARFLMAPASRLTGDVTGFSAASGELSGLGWVGLDRLDDMPLPFVTRIALAEVAAILAGDDQPGVPFFDNSGQTPVFRRIG